MKKLIELKKISVKINKNVILDNVNLSFYKNECIALIGSNGAGKSTLFDVILKLQKLSSGEVVYYQGEENKDINFLSTTFQRNSFSDPDTVNAIVKLFSKFNNVNTNGDYFKKIYNAFNIDEIKNKRCSILSGGEMQRFVFFLALIKPSKIMFLDEISSFLSKNRVSQYINLLIKIAKQNETSLVFITHSKQLCKLIKFNRVIYLKDHKIQLDKKIKNNKIIYDLIDKSE